MPTPGPAFLAPEEQYELYNFQNEEDLAELSRLLQSPPGTRTPVILLAGEAGIGRRYLLEAALYRAKQSRRNLVDTRLDLSKFNPDDPKPFEQFAERCLADCNGNAHKRARQIIHGLARRFEPKLTTDLVSAGLVGMVLEIGMTLTDLFLLYGDTFERIPAAPPSPRESVHLVLKPLTEDRRLVVHMPFGGTLEENLRDTMVNEWKSNPNLTLVFSCHPYHDNEDIALTGSVRRFEVHPVDQGEIRRALERRFDTPALSELSGPLMNYSHGRAGLVARAMRALVSSGAIVFEEERGWDLSAEGLDHPGVAETLIDLYEAIAEGLKRLPRGQRAGVERWLWCAALCEDWFPVELLLRAIGVPEGQEDEWIDAIDEACDIFKNCGSRDPRWPGQLIYEFQDQVLPKILRRHIADDREKLSARLVAFLEPVAPRDSRDVAGLLLRAARFDEVSRERLETRFRYWIGADAAEELTQVLREAVAEGRKDPDQLLTKALYDEDREPVYRVLAMANALVDGGRFAVGADRVEALQLLRGRLLFEGAEYREAEVIFGRVLDTAVRREGLKQALLGSPPMWLAQTWLRMGPERALTFDEKNAVHPVRAVPSGESGQTGYLAASGRLLQLVVEARENPQGSNDLSLGVALYELASVKRSQGHYGEAEGLLTRALRIKETHLGDAHPHVASTLHELANVKHAQGHYGEAEDLLTRALRIMETHLGDAHPDVASTLHGLAIVKHTQGHDGEAEDLLTRALRIRETHLGDAHPNVAYTLSLLAEVRLSQNRRDESRTLLTRALEILAERFPDGHPDIAIISERIRETE